MPNKMLIDASHPEETRVVVVRGNRIEEFDFESQDKKQLRGNIYLARVTRVEPSLQAAFVEYGGNRHGFLAFSEIHADYYQIPVADRQALLRAEAEAAGNDDDDDEESDDHAERGRGRRRRRGGRNRPREEDASGDTGQSGDEATELQAGASPSDGPSETEESGSSEAGSSSENGERGENGEDSHASSVMAEDVHAHVIAEEHTADADAGGHPDDANGADEIESVGSEDAIDEARTRRRTPRRTYKIQEVIKRRQILLVQVVKEERGNKGAALTTYLSLAGRYSVLMPNTARGGGISRKITNAQDRKRLKDVVKELDVPQGMGVILRTAGENRTRAEIKRDYEYLMRLWENVRNLTLQSTAPALVYEEGSLIKRSVRDLYNKDIDEILVGGDDGYREAKDFMRMLMPSHAKVVQPYKDVTPMFARNGIEAQLDRMLQPQVTLKSGGYIIINQTEALVAIDVNSGRSTKEHSIEDTALQTNLEAADEVARQLRLRDLAGLIVIDFIDMEENRNNRSVEKRLKDCLKNDRARIQVGRISHFGLLEMSRQRIRASVLESTMKPCPHCGGTGHIRSESSVALHVVRAIEEFLLKDASHNINVRTPASTALYVLNHKRANLAEMESRFGLSITIETDDTVGGQHCIISRGTPTEHRPAPTAAPLVTEDVLEQDEDGGIEEESEAQTPPHADRADSEDGEGQRDHKRRRRRRRRGRDSNAAPAGETEHNSTFADDAESAAASASARAEVTSEPAGPDAAHEGGDEGEHKKRRRGKRGGKRNRHDDSHETGDGTAFAAETDAADVHAGEEAHVAPPVAEPQSDTGRDATDTPVEPRDEGESRVGGEPQVGAEPMEVAEAPKKAARRSPRKPRTAAAKAADAVAPAAPVEEADAPREAAVTPPAAANDTLDRAGGAVQPAPDLEKTPAAEEPDGKPRKAGWWQRKSFF